MKDKQFHKYSIRAIVALLCAALVSSCAYESYSPGNYPSSNRGTGSSVAPVLVGAAAVGALVLASRHSSRKNYRRCSHGAYAHQCSRCRHGSSYSSYSHHRPHYSHRATRHVTHRPSYSYNTHRSHRNHSSHRSHNNHRFFDVKNNITMLKFKDRDQRI